MPGEQSVHSDEASDFRKILEKTSPNSTFSLRSELFSDGDSHKGYRTKTHRTSSHKRHRSRTHKEREADGAVDVTMLQARQLTRLLAREELGAIGLRKAIAQAAERLDQESRRATEAETRAREAEARVLALKAARHAAQVDAHREQETLKAYQAQLEVARSEIHRAQKELDSLAGDKERAEEEAARERSKARAMAKEIEVQRARELGWEEGKTQGYVEGRKDGWKLGTRQGIKTAYKGMYVDVASFESRSSTSPPLTNSGQPPHVAPSLSSPAMRPRSSVHMPSGNSVSEPKHRSMSVHTSHKRSGSIKSHIRINSDPRPSSPNERPSSASAHVVEERIEMISRAATPRPNRSPSRERTSPIPAQNRTPTPRHSPLPEGYIPLVENGRVAMPPPNQIGRPPPSPHTPTIPLPSLVNDVAQNLQPPSPMGNAGPTITVQEPTPPEPPMTMPEPHPAPTPVVIENVGPSQVLEYGGSPPLPSLPSDAIERSNKGKQRQRMGPRRGGAGLHAPGRSSPSDTSTEFSQFEIVEQPERVRVLGMGRGNGSQLSVIMEGGSTAAESPEPERFPTPQIKHASATRDIPSRGPAASPRQGILNDPREYAEFSEPPLSPTELAHRRLVADQLRYSPSVDNRTAARSVRDDVSIKSTTTRDSAPRRRPKPKMPERLAASRDVEVLEKQAEMYDAFGTGRFPTFESQSQSSPDDPAVSTRTPEFNQGRRSRPMSASTTVPEITIQPPSRPSSKGSKIGRAGNLIMPELDPVPVPTPATPARRHSILGSPLSPSRIPLPLTSAQIPMSIGTPLFADIGLPPGFVPQGGAPLTPSRVPLPHTSGQTPMPLKSPNLGDLGLPPGFVPMQGPSDVMDSFASAIPPKTPGMNASGLLSKTPYRNSSTLPPLGGPPGFLGRTPSGIPLPLSGATTARGLPDYAPSAPRTGRSSYRELPRGSGTPHEAGPSPSNFKYPMTPARMPLPESVAGSPRGSTAQTPWGAWGNTLAADASPGPGPGPGPGSGPSMSATLGRPMSLYSGEGPKQKVSSTSLASLYKKFDPSAYVDPAFLASSSAGPLPAEPATEMRTGGHGLSRAASLRSTKTNKSKVKSIYAPSVETASDEGLSF